MLESVVLSTRPHRRRSFDFLLFFINVNKIHFIFVPKFKEGTGYASSILARGETFCKNFQLYFFWHQTCYFIIELEKGFKMKKRKQKYEEYNLLVISYCLKKKKMI